MESKFDKWFTFSIEKDMPAEFVNNEEYYEYFKESYKVYGEFKNSSKKVICR